MLFYNSKIGVMWWIVELGKIDVITELSLLSYTLDLLCEGHLEAVFCTFAYLKILHNTRLVLDPSYAAIDM